MGTYVLDQMDVLQVNVVFVRNNIFRCVQQYKMHILLVINKLKALLHSIKDSK